MIFASLFTMASTLVIAGLRHAIKNPKLTKYKPYSLGNVSRIKIFHDMISLPNIYTEREMRRQISEVKGIPGGKLVVLHKKGSDDYPMFYLPVAKISDSWIDSWRDRLLPLIDIPFYTDFYCTVLICSNPRVNYKCPDEKLIRVCKELGMIAAYA